MGLRFIAGLFFSLFASLSLFAQVNVESGSFYLKGPSAEQFYNLSISYIGGCEAIHQFSYKKLFCTKSVDKVECFFRIEDNTIDACEMKKFQDISIKAANLKIPDAKTKIITFIGTVQEGTNQTVTIITSTK